MELIFREGIVEDLPQLHELKRIAYGQYKPVFTPENWAIWEANVNSRQPLLDLFTIAATFVCTHGERVVGMAYIVPSGHPNDIMEAEWSYIRLVGVDPEYVGRGIAKKLTQMCLDHAWRAGEKMVALHTSEFMDAARHIYESLGFSVLREIPPRYGKKYWLYTLDLGLRQIDIVSFREHHQPGIDAMLLRIKEEYAENIFSKGYKKTSEVYTLPGRYYWTALDGDTVVGTVGLIIKENYAVLKAMFVDRAYRGGGEQVARRLLHKAIDRATVERAEYLYLGTMTQFKAAQRFYEKNGFNRIGEMALPASYPGNNMDTVFFQLRLR